MISRIYHPTKSDEENIMLSLLEHTQLKGEIIKKEIFMYGKIKIAN